MIFDSFLFHGEYDILELRLNILGDVVDKFVICEALQAFNGEQCGSYFEKEKDRFKKWEDKIINYQFDLLADETVVKLAKESPNTEYGNPFWMKVFYAMEMLKRPLECKDEDIVFISDIDEIWNPALELKTDGKVYGLEQTMYYYYLNNQTTQPWTGSIYTTYGRLKNEIVNNIKQRGEVKVPNGGWHFTFQGGEAPIKKKMTESAEAFYGFPLEEMLENVKQNKDFFDGFMARGITFERNEENWPEYLKQNKELYQHLL